MAFLSKTKRELQAALEQLEAAENRATELQADLTAIESSFPVLVMSPDGIIERVNDLFLELVGFSRDQLLGQHHRVICEGGYAASEQYIVFWRELVLGKVRQGLFRNVCGDGGVVQLETRYLPVVTEKRLLKRVIAVVSHTTPA